MPPICPKLSKIAHIARSVSFVFSTDPGNFCRVVKMKPKAVARPNPNLVGCKLSRDNQPGAVFTHDSGRFVRVEDTFKAIYSQGIMLVDKLNEGTVATVRLGTGNVAAFIQVTYLLERKGQYDLYREGVTVFSVQTS